MRTVGEVTRINIELDDELHRRAKAEAALRGVPLKDWVADVIEAALKDPHRPWVPPSRRTRRSQ